MAALNFPANPTNGQTYTFAGRVWIYSTDEGAWQSTSNLGGVLSVAGKTGDVTLTPADIGLDADLSAIGTLTGVGLLRRTGTNTWELDTTTYLSGNQTITLSGDVSGSGATAISVTLANSGVTAGTYGSSSAVPVITVDGKGRITSVSTSSISGALTFTGDVTGTGTTGSSTTLTLSSTGVAAGTYTKVTVDAKGRVTSATTLSSADLPTYTGTITSSQVTTALGFTPENAANKGVANGYASLDASAKVPAAQLPSYVDDVLEYANLAGFPGTGTAGVIYVAIDTNKVYRWTGSAYVEISPSPGSTDAVTEGSTNLYFTTARARNSVSAAGSLSYNASTGVFSYTQPTNVSTFSNDSGYITSAALSGYLTSATAASTYLPLSGGTISAGSGYPLILNTTQRYVLWLRNTNSTGTGWWLANDGGSLVFHANGISDLASLNSAGTFNAVNLTVGGNQVLHASNYGSYALPLSGGTLSGELISDTATGTSNAISVRKAGVTARGVLFAYGDGNGPSHGFTSNMSLNSGGGASRIASAYSAWSVSMDNRTTSDVFRVAYMSTSDVYSNYLNISNTGVVTFGSNTALHAGNYNSYSPTLTGGGASGTWTINITGSAGSAGEIGGYTSDGWLRKVNDNTQFKIYGNSHTVIFRTDGVTNPHGGGGYAYIWYYGGSSDSNRRMILATDGNLWTNSYGWMHEAFAYTGGSNASGNWGINITGSASKYGGFIGDAYNDRNLRIYGGTNGDMGILGVAANGSFRFQLYGDSGANYGFLNGAWAGWDLQKTTNGQLYLTVSDTVYTALHSGNYSSYALPLSGGTISGNLTVSGSAYSTFSKPSPNGYQTVALFGNTDGGVFITSNNAIITKGAYYNGSWVATSTFGSGIDLQAADAKVFYFSGATIGQTPTMSTSYNILHAGNYSSYALPLSGGTLSGAIAMAGTQTITTAGFAGIEYYNAAGTWEGYIGTESNAGHLRYNSRQGLHRWYANSTNIATLGSSGFKLGNNLAHPNVQWSASSGTGMVIFKLPGETGNYGMVHMVFDIYEYNSNAVSTVIVGGHNWQGGWYNVGCNVVGQTNKTVRLGFKDGQYCVVFGGVGSTWEYGTIVLRKIHNGSFYDNNMDLLGSYSAALTNTESFSSVTGDLRALRTPSTFNAGGAITEAGNQVLHAGNYTSYAMPSTGIPNGSDVYANFRVIRNLNASPNDGMFIGYGNGGSGATRLYGGGSTGAHAYVDANGDIWRSSGSHQYVYNTGTWGISITGNAATATSATDSTKLPLAGGVMTGTTTFAQGANIAFGNSTNEAGPWTISVNGSGGSTPATKGTGRGRNLIVKAGDSDNTAGYAGGDLYLRPGSATAPSVVYGDVRIADLGGEVYLRGGEVAIGSGNVSSYAIVTTQATSSVAGEGWYRVATSPGSDGRGTYNLELNTTGGSNNPASLTIYAMADWGYDKIIYTTWDGNFPASSVRITRKTTAPTATYVEVYFTGAVPGFYIRANRTGYDTGCTPYSGALPAGGDTVQDTLPIAGRINAASVYVNGYQVIHANNYGSYALPLTGGTVTGTLLLTSAYAGGSGDYTAVTNPPLKVSVATGYWRIPHLSENASISGVYNYQSGKNVYWGEPNDSGGYYFRGRTLNWTSGSTDYPILHSSNYSSYALPLGGGTVTGDVLLNGYTRLRASDGLIFPVTDNTAGLGGAGNRFSAVYATTLYYGASNTDVSTAIGARAPTSNVVYVNNEYAAGIGTDGWYTIAEYGSGRAQGTFHIFDQDSSRHNYVRVNITWSYGLGGAYVVSSGRHGSSTIRHVRLLYNTGDQTYGGVKVQVYCENAEWSGGFTLRVRQETIGLSGWGAFTQVTPTLANTVSGFAEYSRAYYVNDNGWLSVPTGLYIGGNTTLHSGNYNSYALPLSGGTVTGATRVTPRLSVGGTSTDATFGVAGTTHLTGYIYMDMTGALGNINTWSGRLYSTSGTTYISTSAFQVNREGYGGGTVLNIDTSGNLSGPSSVSATEIYTTGGWFRNHTNNNGIYWSQTGWHLYPYDSADFYMRSGTTEVTLRMIRSDGTVMGYLHYASDYACGFLTSGRSWRLRTDNSGNTQTYGTMYASGDVIAYYSDERLKTKVGRIDNALEKVKSLEGFWYFENDLAKSLGYSNDNQQVGVSAQRVQAVMPEAVALAPADRKETPNGETESKSGENYLTVKYERLVPLLIEAIKEQQEKIEALEARLAALG